MMTVSLLVCARNVVARPSIPGAGTGFTEGDGNMALGNLSRSRQDATIASDEFGSSRTSGRVSQRHVDDALGETRPYPESESTRQQVPWMSRIPDAGS